jgi:hypothetical protein
MKRYLFVFAPYLVSMFVTAQTIYIIQIGSKYIQKAAVI